MKTNILISLAIIILVAGSFTSSAVYAQTPTVTVTRVYWGSSTSNLIQTAPGDINIPLNVVIQNYGTDQITSLNAQLDLHNLPFTDSATGGSYSTAGYSDTIKSGQSTTLTFYLNITPNAEIKTYDVPLTLEVITPKYQTTVDVPLTVKVPLLGKTALSLDVTPASLPTGNSQLNLTLTNSGTGSASSVQVSLSVSTPLAITGQSNILIEDPLSSEANFTFPVSLYIPSTSEGSAYTITVAITYSDPYGTTRSETHQVGFSVERERTQFDITITPSMLNVGDNDVVLSISNKGSSASNVELTFDSPNMLVIADGVSRWAFPFLAYGETTTVDIPVYVPESSTGGIGDGSLSISYTNPEGITKTESRSFSLAVLQPSNPNILLSSHGTRLTSGSENTVSLELVNEGNSDVYSLDVTVTTPSSATTYPLMLLGSDNRWHFDEIKSKGSVTINMTLITATGITGTYPLTVTLTYQNKAGNTFTETRTLGLLVSLAKNEWRSPLDIYTDTDSLTAGSVNKPTITIKNSGASVLNSVEVLISTTESYRASSDSDYNPPVVTSGTERWLFEDVKSGENMIITPEVVPSLDSADNSHIMTLSISYLDSLGNIHEESRTLGFTIKGTIVIVVQEEQVSPTSISAGEEFTLTGNVLNKGSTDALYSAISLKPNSNFVSSSGSQYIGDLTVNTQLPFALSASAQRNLGEGTYPVTAVLTYEDSYGKTYSEEFTVDISISKSTAQPTDAQGGTSDTLSLFGIFFLVALVAIVGGGAISILRVYRGRKRT